MPQETEVFEVPVTEAVNNRFVDKNIVGFGGLTLIVTTCGGGPVNWPFVIHEGNTSIAMTAATIQIWSVQKNPRL